MTNYEYYLGTPALAAQFVAKIANSCSSGEYFAVSPDGYCAWGTRRES